MRLNKFLASAGIDSRRNCDQIILDGRVSVNGQVIKTLGVIIDPIKDSVSVDNKPIKVKDDFVYLMLNKPVEVVSTVKDPQGRKTVMDCLPKQDKRIYPIGRLDFYTSGLLLFTNDGEVTNKLIHPSSNIEKVYLGTVCGKLTEQQIKNLREGVNIGDNRPTAPARITLANVSKDNHSTYRIVIHEGRNRQIRRMFEAVGSKIIRLKRIEFGEIKLGTLPIGKTRELTKEEIKYITSL